MAIAMVIERSRRYSGIELHADDGQVRLKDRSLLRAGSGVRSALM